MLFRSFELLCQTLRRIWLVGCTTILFQSTKNIIGPAVLFKCFREAVSLTTTQYCFQKNISKIPDGIMLVDEPPWHKLWIKMFPSNKHPNLKLMSYVINSLMNINHRSNIIIINVTLSSDVCVDRIIRRHNKNSRFNNKSEFTILSNLKKDFLYPKIQEIVKANAVGDVSFFEIGEKISIEAVVEKILEIKERNSTTLVKPQGGVG